MVCAASLTVAVVVVALCFGLSIMVRVGTLGPSLMFQGTGARTGPLLDVTLHSMPIDASTTAVLRWTLRPGP